MIPKSHAFRVHSFGASAPWVDLANSQMWDGYGKPTDFLEDPEWLHDFQQFWTLRAPAPTPASLRELRALRKVLREAVAKISRGTALRTRDVQSLNAWLKVPVFRQLQERQNGWELMLEPVQIGWETVVSSIVASFAETLVQESQDRMKVCANEGCKWVFVDRTKGKVRRWCNDATCGNRDRVRRSRAARKGKGERSI